MSHFLTNTDAERAKQIVALASEMGIKMSINPHATDRFGREVKGYVAVYLEDNYQDLGEFWDEWFRRKS